MLNQKIGICALAVKAALLTSFFSTTPSALADTDANKEQALEVIEIRGIRASQEANLNAKRYSGAVVDVVTAEDIGKFPDKNVAESLSRITGVSVTRGFGEGEKIAVRGTDPAQNRTLLNGASVASADWFVLDNPSRAFNFTLLPSNVVSDLEVYKTPQADIQEGSLGGTVYLKTRRPLALDANTVSLQVQGQYSDVSKEWDPQLSGLYSWKNDDENFGLLVSLTQQERSLARKGKEVLGFGRQQVAGEEYWAPRIIGDAYFQQERKRTTALITAQWQPSDKTDIVLNVLDTKLDANNINHNLYTFFNNGFVESSAVIAGSGIVAGQANNTASEFAIIDRISYSDASSYDLEINHTLESGVTVTGKLGTTEAEGGTSRDRYHQFNGAYVSSSYDSGLNLNNFISAGNLESFSDLQNRELSYIQEGARLMTDEEVYGGLDFAFELDKGIFTRLKTGVLYQDHDKSQRQTGTRFHWLADSQHIDPVNGPYGAVKAGEGNWLGSLAGTTFADLYSGSDYAYYPLMNSANSAAKVFPANAYNSPSTEFLFLPNTWKVNEKISAAYVKADFSGESVRGDIGVRVVKTDVSSSGYSWTGDWVAASINMVGGYSLLADLVEPGRNGDWGVSYGALKHSYTDVLPNINLVFDVSADSLIRFSAARVMSRPDYVNIANQQSVNIPTRTGTRGNPFLDPVRANQFDIGYEWYFNPSSLIAFTFFHKDIQGSVLNSVTREMAFDEINNEQVEVTITEPKNGLGGRVQGVEVSYQQAFGDFGLITNYTYTDAKSEQERDAVNNPGSGLIAGNSRHMANLTGYFENDVFSARLSYNYRTEFFNGVGEFGNEVYTDAFGQLDASLTYNFSETISFVVEAVNLLDEDLYQYHIDKARPASLYKNGRRFTAGVNIRF
ncbi:TonB-dependent receptor [Alishewanella longhuensis]